MKDQSAIITSDEPSQAEKMLDTVKPFPKSEKLQNIINQVKFQQSTDFIQKQSLGKSPKKSIEE